MVVALLLCGFGIQDAAAHEAEAYRTAERRSEELDHALRSLVRRAVRLAARSDPNDVIRARAALAPIDARIRRAEFRRQLLLGTPGARRFVISELVAWRDLSQTRSLVSLAVSAGRAEDRRLARRALQTLDDPETAGHLTSHLTDPISTRHRDRALELAARFGDLRLVETILPMLEPAVDALRSLEQQRAAGGPAAVAASDALLAELQQRADRVVAALRRCSGEDFGADAAAWRRWVQSERDG